MKRLHMYIRTKEAKTFSKLIMFISGGHIMPIYYIYEVIWYVFRLYRKDPIQRNRNQYAKNSISSDTLLL